MAVLNEKALTKIVRTKIYGNTKIKTAAIPYDDDHYLFTNQILVVKVKTKTLTEKMIATKDFDDDKCDIVERLFRDYDEHSLDEDSVEFLGEDYVPKFYKEYCLRHSAPDLYWFRGDSFYVSIKQEYLKTLLQYNPKFYCLKPTDGAKGSPLAVKIGNKLYALIMPFTMEDGYRKIIWEEIQNVEV